MQPEGTKTCTGCGKTKSHSEFHRHQSGGFGLRAHCKACRRASNLANKEARRAYFADYHRRNAERICARVNEWRRQASGEKLDRYKASVAAGVRRFQQTEKGQLATARSNLAKLTGLPVEYLDPAAIEAKAQQVRLTRMCRALKKGR